MSDILSTLAILKEHTWLDLSHEVSPEIRVFPAFSPLVENTLFTVATDGLFANEYTLATQYGTHLDAPVHFSNGKRSLEEIPVDELVLPLYVINKADAVKENPDFTLSVAAIVEFEATNGASCRTLLAKSK